MKTIFKLVLLFSLIIIPMKTKAEVYNDWITSTDCYFDERSCSNVCFEHWFSGRTTIRRVFYRWCTPREPDES